MKSELEKCLAGELYECHNPILLYTATHPIELDERLTPDWNKNSCLRYFRHLRQL